MKISIAYPPIDDAKGIPLLSQNRQFQWFNHPTYIYPVVPAYAATLLEKNGFEVTWNDGIASEQTFDTWFEEIKKENPDLIERGIFVQKEMPEYCSEYNKIIEKAKKRL